MLSHIGGQSPPESKRRPRAEAALLRNTGYGNDAENSRCSEPVNLLDVRFARLCERLHAFGPRPFAEFLAELGGQYLLRTPIESLAADYVTRLDPTLLREFGADRFPPGPIHLVEP
jgi:hypothetical protein